jgi:hypothetical protein
MIVRGQTLTIVAGHDWRHAVEIVGGAEPVRLDGGRRRIMWVATRDLAQAEPSTLLNFSISWFPHDGWHVHATSRGTAPGILLTTAWRDGGGLAVELADAGEGTVGLIELREVLP